MKFCCASNAAIKNVKIVRKKNNFFSKIFSTKSPFFKKLQNFRKHILYFETPLRPNHFFCYTVLNYFWGKVPNAQKCSSKIKCVRAKNRRGVGLLKLPPGSYRVKDLRPFSIVKDAGFQGLMKHMFHNTIYHCAVISWRMCLVNDTLIILELNLYVVLGVLNSCLNY